MEWQPISTAPRDGTWFIAACFGYGDADYEVGCYDPLQFPKYEEVGSGLYRREMVEAYQWRGFNNMHRMTHWLPIPAPPKAEGK
jgi:hypothetical protein